MNQKIVSAKYIMPIPGKILENHYVTVVNGRITGISKFHTMKTTGTQSEFISLGNSVLMPGFVNAHVNLELCSDSLSSNDPCDYFSMLDQVTKQRQFNADNPFALKNNVQNAIDKLIRGGSTSIGNFTTTLETSTQVLDRNLTAVEFAESHSLFRDDNEERFIQNDQLRTEIKLKVLQKIENQVKPVKFEVGVAPRSIYSSNPEFLDQFFSLFTKENIRFATHIAEHEDEDRLFQLGDGKVFEYLVKRYDLLDYEFPPAASAVEFLASMLEEFDKTALNYTPMIVNASYVDEEDIKFLADLKSSVVFCPSFYESFENRHARKFPFKQFIDKLIPVALGTDSTMAGSNLSMLDEIRLLARNNPELLVTDMLRMATINGAKALNITDSAGIISENRIADLIAIEIPANTTPEDVATEIIYGSGEVKMTMLKGDIAHMKF